MLCSKPGTILEKSFNEYHETNKTDEKIFIDRDPSSFTHMLNYLRNDMNYNPTFESRAEEDLFLQELRFWEIDCYGFNL